MAGKIAKHNKKQKAASSVKIKGKGPQERLGVTFGIGRIARYMRQRRLSERTSRGAAIFLAAVLDYLTLEILELAGGISEKHKMKTIKPRHIKLALS